MSFESVNFPDHYLAIASVAKKSVGIAVNPDANDATWIITAPLAPKYNNYSYSIRSASAGPLGGLYLSASALNTAPCAYSAPAGDAVLTNGSDTKAATWFVPRCPFPLNI